MKNHAIPASNTNNAPPRPGGNKQMLLIYHITLSMLYTCMHKRDIQLDLAGNRFPYPSRIRREYFSSMLPRSSVILGECTMSCALLFPILVLFPCHSFFSSFSFEFYFKMELYVSLRRNLLNEMLDSLGILLAECIVIILHKCIVIILYCSSKLCFVEFENNGIE